MKIKKDEVEQIYKETIERQKVTLTNSKGEKFVFSVEWYYKDSVDGQPEADTTFYNELGQVITTDMIQDFMGDEYDVDDLLDELE